MNEPIQRVSRQEDSNSTIGTIATHMGINLGVSAAMEGGSILGAKHINPQKNPTASALLKNMAYGEGIDTHGKFVQTMTSGFATKRGRIANYGASAATGLLTGVLAANNS